MGGGVRANYLGGEVEVANKDRFNFINVFAFGRPADGSLGNVGKYVLRRPGINQWDLSLFKNTRLTEAVNVQFRFEMFNAFNHTQWDGLNTGLNVPNPNTAVTEATRGTFGQVNSTRDPRTLQFGLKLLF
jgi:hypothetical protein